MRANERFGTGYSRKTSQQITRCANRLLTTLTQQRRLNRSGPFAV